MDFPSLIKENGISISESDWLYLNLNFSKEEIIQKISDSIASLPLPLREITEKEMREDFQSLQRLDSSKLIRKSPVFTKYPYFYSLRDSYLDLSNVGNRASDYFHQNSRFLCDSINSPSPYRVWNTEKFRKNMLKSLWTLKHKEINSNTLRTSLSLRNYVASQFRPSSAKAIYSYFGSRRVLDFSSGWGDRLAAFCSLPQTEFYMGIDPNSRLFEGYNSQILAYGSSKKFEMINLPAEDVDYGKEQFDTVFTSPPYFDIERYTQESNQSWKRYKTLDKWLSNFLFVVLEKSWRALQPNGFLIINIADVYCHHRVNQICDSMNDFISTLPNADYRGGVGYRMAKRPNSKADNNPNFVYVEPVWVWRKTTL